MWKFGNEKIKKFTIQSTVINCVLQIVYLFDIKSNQHISTSKNQPIKV